VHWQWPVGDVLAFLLAIATTPAGVSGAVLLPIQLRVLHVASPSVTPTNLLFNAAATPGRIQVGGGPDCSGVRAGSVHDKPALSELLGVAVGREVSICRGAAAPR